MSFCNKKDNVFDMLQFSFNFAERVNLQFFCLNPNPEPFAAFTRQACFLMPAKASMCSKNVNGANAWYLCGADLVSYFRIRFSTITIWKVVRQRWCDEYQRSFIPGHHWQFCGLCERSLECKFNFSSVFWMNWETLRRISLFSLFIILFRSVVLNRGFKSRMRLPSVLCAALSRISIIS